MGTQWGSILQILDASAVTQQIYPAFGVPLSISNITNQSFVAPYNFAFNVVWLFTQDRAWNPTPITVNVNNSVGLTLASGTMNSAAGYLQTGIGTDEWIPVVLNTTVSATMGSTYTITATGAEWNVLQMNANPQANGFQNQNDWYIFALGS